MTTACPHMKRISKRRLRFRGSNGVPTRVVKVKPLCRQASPAAALAAAWSFSRMRNAVTQIPGGGSVASDASVLGFPVKKLTTDALEPPADIKAARCAGRRPASALGLCLGEDRPTRHSPGSRSGEDDAAKQDSASSRSVVNEDVRVSFGTYYEVQARGRPGPVPAGSASGRSSRWSSYPCGRPGVRSARLACQHRRAARQSCDAAHAASTPLG